MIEHCVAAFQQEEKTLAFRVYVTDALQIIAENTTHHIGKSGMVDYGRSLTARWYDLTGGKTPTKEKPVEDTRSCEEITAAIWERARISPTNKGGET